MTTEVRRESVVKRSDDLRSLFGSRGAIGVAAVLGVAVLLTLFRRWEPTDETWIYWLWTRVFRETGHFVVLYRSPLYTLYLDVFTWLPFPAMVIAEYITSSLMVGAALIVFGERFLGRWGAALAAVAWIPVLQIAEPPSQKLALAASLAAILVRMQSVERRARVVSYALFFFAYLFRGTWIVFPLVFAAYDGWREIRGRRSSAAWRGLIPRPRTDWTLAIPLFLLAWFVLMQSPLTWNNAIAATPTWMPVNVTTADSSFVSLYNVAWVEEKYPSPQDREDKDWYFTDREAFGGAQDLLGIIKADPAFFVRQLLGSTVLAVRVSAAQTVVDTLISWLPGAVAIETLVLAGIGYGAWRTTRTAGLEPFVIATVLMVGSIVLLAAPRQRYVVVELIPLLMLAVPFYAGKAIRSLEQVPTWTIRMRHTLAIVVATVVAAYFAFLLSRVFTGRYVPVGLLTVTFFGILGLGTTFILLRPARAVRHAARAAVPTIVLLLSLGLTSWESVLADMMSDARTGQIALLEANDFSVIAAEPLLLPLLRGCSGIMSAENRFIGAFSDIALDRVRDIWEIPPFGQLDASVYDGLRPSRVDCVVVSEYLATTVGQATNVKLRYDNYIRPYVARLLAEGAQRHEIARFGTVVIASPR